ncbi:MAG: PHP-associated domain-containing protein, partial [Chloroflexota bacterium]
DYARRHDLPGTVGSDAHSVMEYGRSTLRMQPFDGPDSFLAALHSAEPVERLSPFYVHFSSTFAKYSRKLGIIPRAPKATQQVKQPTSV